MQLFTIISLLIAISGAAYAVIAAAKEYTEVFVENKIEVAKEHLQNTTPEKSGNKKLYSQACSNHKWGIRFAWFYRIFFFAPIIIFSSLVIIITSIVYKKGGPNTEILTAESWPTYKVMLFWVPISYVILIVLGLVCIGLMKFFFYLLKNKSEVGLEPNLVMPEVTKPEQTK